MASSEMAKAMRRARIRYELGRLRRALIAVAPFLLVVAVALWRTHGSSSTLWLGFATVALSTAMFWYGRDSQRAVLPGVAAGIVPLAVSLCANAVHGCGVGSCSSLCLPACTLGGAVGGLAIASVGNQRGAGPSFWLSASGVALLTGAMGCACVGYSGVMGLGLGFAVGVVPGVLRRTRAPRAL
jgi:hypothetical protein